MAVIPGSARYPETLVTETASTAGSHAHPENNDLFRNFEIAVGVQTGRTLSEWMSEYSVEDLVVAVSVLDTTATFHCHQDAIPRALKEYVDHLSRMARYNERHRAERNQKDAERKRKKRALAHAAKKLDKQLN